MPDPDPLDCIRPRLACRRHGGRRRREAGPHDLHGSLQRRPRTRPRSASGRALRPDAKLIALKIFGCEGSTILTIDALEWVAEYNATHADAIDVVNMSLGGAGGAETADALATDALVASRRGRRRLGQQRRPQRVHDRLAGATRPASSPSPSVDTIAAYPGATIDRATGTDINGINQNALPGPAGRGHAAGDRGRSGTPIDPTTGEGDEHLGCHDGRLRHAARELHRRSSSAASARSSTRARRPQAAGAIGIIIINRDDVAAQRAARLPGLRAVALRHPHGRRRAVGQGRALEASDGMAATLATGPSITNDPNTSSSYATFSSGGPRLGDSAAEAGRQRPGREHRLDPRRPRVQGQPALRHLDGVAACRGRRGARAPAAIRASGPEQIKALIVGTAVQAKVSPFNSASRVRASSSRGARSTPSAYVLDDGADAQPLVRLRPDPDRRPTASPSRSRSTTRARRRSPTSSTAGSITPARLGRAASGS